MLRRHFAIGEPFAPLAIICVTNMRFCGQALCTSCPVRVSIAREPFAGELADRVSAGIVMPGKCCIQGYFSSLADVTAQRLLTVVAEMRTWLGRVLPPGWTWCWVCGWPVRASHYNVRKSEVPESDHRHGNREAFAHGQALPYLADIEKGGLWGFIPGWPVEEGSVPKPRKASVVVLKKPAATTVLKKPAAVTKKTKMLQKKPAALLTKPAAGQRQRVVVKKRGARA